MPVIRCDVSPMIKVLHDDERGASMADAISPLRCDQDRPKGALNFDEIFTARSPTIKMRSRICRSCLDAVGNGLEACK